MPTKLAKLKVFIARKESFLFPVIFLWFKKMHSGRFPLAAVFLLFAFCFLSSHAKGQSAIDVGGIVTVNYLDGSDSKNSLGHNYGLPGFEWVGDLFMNMRISNEASAFLELESWYGWEVRLYSGSFTYKISGERLQVEAGKFAAPFGNFVPRRFAPQNFVYGYPLFYEYRTGLTNDAAPQSPEVLLGARGGTRHDNNLAMIARQAYITGVQFFGKLGALGYHLGLANGALSNPSNLSETKRPMIFSRLHLQPAIGFTIGMSMANGNYLNSAPVQANQPDLRPQKFSQSVAGIDVEYSRGYLVFFGEGAFSRWESPLPEALDALAFSAEMRYKILARLFVAARYGRIHFSEIADAQDLDADGKRTEPWEVPIWRLESAIGYNLSRHALVKAVWQINRNEAQNFRGGDPADDLVAIQMAVFY
jgi:hypothetical protein